MISLYLGHESRRSSYLELNVWPRCRQPWAKFVTFLNRLLLYYYFTHPVLHSEIYMMNNMHDTKSKRWCCLCFGFQVVVPGNSRVREFMINVFVSCFCECQTHVDITQPHNDWMNCFLLLSYAALMQHYSTHINMRMKCLT